MSKTETVQHTPGPWFVNPTGDIGLWHIGTPDCPIASVETELPDRIWKANARLIAAAPELLEACKKIIAAYSEGKINYGSVSESNVLLAFICDAANKAEGRT